MTEPRAQSSRDGSISSTNSGGATAGGGGAAGFLSKITRSPSRRHKPLGSNGSIDGALSGAGATPPRQRPRPGYTRTATAPPAPITLNAIKADLVSRTTSDGSGLVASDHKMLPLPMGNIAPAYNTSGTNRVPLYKVNSNVSIGDDSTSTHTTKSKEKEIREQDVASALVLNGMIPTSQAAMAAVSMPTNSAYYTHLQEMIHKRVATLDYLRKAHEGRSFWFNTVQFQEADIARLPSYTPNRLSRRAVNYMLLGMSLPTILDFHPPQPQAQTSVTASTAVAQDYLKNLNTLLTEFESFQQFHPPDGSSASTLSRARIPQMFKRSATTSRPRKSSGPVTDIGLPMLPTTSPPSVPEGSHHGAHPSLDTTSSGITFASSATTLVNPSPLTPMSAINFPTATSFPPPAPFDAPNSTLLPNEGPYTHLQTPPLPFTPDFFTVFATLCDVLIDAYQRLLQIIATPPACTPGVSDLFSKVDGRIRKVMVSAIIREFEQASRETAKKEMLGVQKVVLGGLLG
ncbi:hypothetical protein H2200_008569 [Cladophialophora chaetospira]|uniref:Uncharacterized protein n=1 Tax=Cladophialophora chaetospira TaxID=386627 RepID=A0AA38X4B5_9EURO|nr:hypothetical protein H2200_008569 [Cladophialophora chaetospira]